jgi:hypothetical protein
LTAKQLQNLAQVCVGLTAKRLQNLAQVCVGLTAKRLQNLAQVCVGLTAKRLQNLAQGGGFAEPWVPATMAHSSERAKDLVRTQSYKGHAAFENDDSDELACFSSAPSERSTFKILYPGFRKASTLG